ncbi:MAG: glycoside hydrolase family 140 protein [Chitinophagaceae bacterium]
MIKKAFYTLVGLLLAVVMNAQSNMSPMKISSSKRGFTVDGKPFFWLGDTGWLLFVKLNRAETIQYLDTRKQQGYNVIQVMVVHDVKKAANQYGDSALINNDVSKPLVTPGNNPDNAAEYDFWDHVDFVVDEAAKRGIYMAMVPVWGANVKAKWVNETQAKAYATFLAERYKNRANIVWLNGGDIHGTVFPPVWNTIGTVLKEKDPGHLVTFHPFGRHTSSRWFHNASWLDFNMFQSGHRTYAQDTSKGESHYAEDSWKYVVEDLAKKPLKPTMDGEPSYEGIPYGLHDTTQPYWNANEVRRFAYWGVLAGGAGFTYGHNAVMQFYRPGDKDRAYGARKYWTEAINDTAALQMQYLRSLMETVAVADWKEAQAMVVNNGIRYDRVAAAAGTNYLLFYTYTGKDFKLQLGKLKAASLLASWFDPKNGKYLEWRKIPNKGIHTFDPPGEPRDGNDWVLVLKTTDAKK